MRGKKKLDQYPQAKRIITYTNNRGEPLKWGLMDTSTKGIAKFFDNFGLELIEHVNSSEMEEFFLKQKDGKLISRCMGFAHMVVLKVC